MNFIKLLLFIPILISYSCTPAHVQTGEDKATNHTIAYYSSLPLRESPYPAFQGIIRLSKEEALTRNHYRFTYDHLFRLESISFWSGNQLKNPNHTANYFFTAPVQKIEYTDQKEIITYYDRFGNSITQRGAHKSVYTLDQQGRRVSLHFEDEQGKAIENSWGISNYQWEHQTDGSVIEARYNLKEEVISLRPHFEFHRIRLYYEQNGILALMQNIDEQGYLKENNSGVAQDKLLFDSEGRWLGWKVLNAKHELHRGNGPNVAKGINQSNPFGYESGIHFEDTHGSPIMNAHGFWGSKRYYDTYGNYSYTHFTDHWGHPGMNQKSGYCYTFYTHDQKGYNLLKIELKDLDKKSVLHKTRGYATIQYEYDDRDNRIRVSYLGIDGELINRKDNGVAYISYTYDQKNALEGSNRYNLSGELLE